MVSSFTNIFTSKKVVLAAALLAAGVNAQDMFASTSSADLPLNVSGMNTTKANYGIFMRNVQIVTFPSPDDRDPGQAPFLVDGGQIASEGQAYALLFTAGYAAGVYAGSIDDDKTTITAKFYEFFQGWREMCTVTASHDDKNRPSGQQGEYYCLDAKKKNIPCLPHWQYKSTSPLTPQAWGSATDADLDAATGLIVMLLVIAKEPPQWWEEVADFAHGLRKFQLGQET